MADRRRGAVPLRVGPTRARPPLEVSFTLDDAAFVTAAVFDADGRRVRDLESGLLPAGEHALRWDGRDAEGRPVPGGPHFLRLETNGRAQTRALVRVQ